MSHARQSTTSRPRRNLVALTPNADVAAVAARVFASYRGTLTAEQVELANALYTSGWSERQVAAHLDVSQFTVARVIAPEFKRAHLGKRIDVSPEQERDIARMFHDGASRAQISRDLDVALSSIDKVVPPGTESRHRAWQMTEAVRLHDEGVSARRIAEAVGSSDRVVRGWLPQSPDHAARSARYVAPSRTLTRGVNDLQTERPDLAKEWHPSRNGLLTPRDVTRGSSKEVWWQCASGHEWKRRINNRTSQKKGCGKCVSRRRSSIAYEFVEALAEHLGEVKAEHRIPVSWVPSKPGMGAQVDGYGWVDGVRYAFEFDGHHHIGAEEKDLRKTKAILDSIHADFLVRVRYDNMALLDDPDPRHLQFQYQNGAPPSALAEQIAETLRRAVAESRPLAS